MSTDQEREAFEHYFSDGGKSPRSVERGADGKYLLGSAHNAWRVWQASLQQRSDMETQARPITADEYKQGHAPCHCGEFTHIFRQCAMQRLPRDYSGELCPRCSLWMCKADKMEPVVGGDA